MAGTNLDFQYFAIKALAANNNLFNKTSSDIFKSVNRQLSGENFKEIQNVLIN